MTHIQSSLPEANKNIVENLEDELDDDNNPLTTKRTREKLWEKYYWMNVWPETTNSREDEKYLYVKSEYKGTSTISGNFGHKGKHFLIIWGSKT